MPSHPSCAAAKAQEVSPGPELDLEIEQTKGIKAPVAIAIPPHAVITKGGGGQRRSGVAPNVGRNDGLQQALGHRTREIAVTFLRHQLGMGLSVVGRQDQLLNSDKASSLPPYRRARGPLRRFCRMGRRPTRANIVIYTGELHHDADVSGLSDWRSSVQECDDDGDRQAGHRFQS